MKKTLSTLLIFTLLACSLLALASCGVKLSGTYENSVLGLSYDFSGSNVTITKKNLILKDIVVDGTYEITKNDDGDDVIIFTIEAEEEDMKDLSGEFSFVKGEEGDTEYIKIGGVKYTKKTN